MEASAAAGGGVRRGPHFLRIALRAAARAGLLSYVAGQPLERRPDARERLEALAFAILTVSAVQSSSAGVGLLATYAAGLGLPFLLVALFTRELAARLKGLRRFGAALQIAAGLILALMGIAMMTGQLSRFGFWLLETFPALGRIG